MYSIPSQSNATEIDRVHFDQMNERATRYDEDQLECNHKLSLIAEKYKDLTDKCPTTSYWRKHTYTEFYGPLLEHMQSSPVNVLEIGVRRGGSLLMWSDFFPNGTVYGVDIDIGHVAQLPAKINLIQGNGYDAGFAEKMFSGIEFDIILDDGTHHKEDQLTFFNTYRHYLKKGGYLLCEDFKSMGNAKYVVKNFEGKINNISIIDRTHCIPSTKGEFVVLYKS